MLGVYPLGGTGSPEPAPLCPKNPAPKAQVFVQFYTPFMGPSLYSRSCSQDCIWRSEPFARQREPLKHVTKMLSLYFRLQMMLRQVRHRYLTPYLL